MLQVCGEFVHVQDLTLQKAGFFRRGKNMSHMNVPKNATPSEYRAATGMETLFGFLHLSGNDERARELFALAYPEKTEN